MISVSKHYDSLKKYKYVVYKFRKTSYYDCTYRLSE